MLNEMMPPVAGGGMPSGEGYAPLPQGPQVQEDLAPQGMPMEDPSAGKRDMLDRAIMEANLAKNKSEEKLSEVATDVVQGYETDYLSVEPWLRANREWLKMALLFREQKSFPWPKASAAKFPLLATAAMQFAARAYPTLVPSDKKLVKAKVLGPDPTEEKSKRAKRIADHMSYHILEKCPAWEEEFDKLLYMEAISGIAFKKTFFDPVLGVAVSKIIYPENLIINYYAKSIEDAYRKTELLYLTHNEYLEKVASGEFLDIDNIREPAAPATSLTNQQPNTQPLNLPVTPDKATPHVFLAQHTFYDLDGDGYAEPLVIVVHYESKKVVRIVARYNSDGIHMDAEGKEIVKIDPIEYFTAFQFIPSPDGSLYGQGLGSLLGNINESVNSILNQLIDAGTLNNLQSGFIGKGLRIKMGQVGLQPGEWKVVNATGDDLNKSIFPLPSKEPSAVLFNLMQLLITSGNQLASVAEIMVGKMPGQNTPATTTQETVDQAMKVFTAVYKRNFRSLEKEFKKIYNIFRLHPEIVQEDAQILDLPLQPTDYSGPEDDIIPAADPTGDSITVRMGKLQHVGQLLQFGTINIMEFTKRSLEIAEIPNPEALMQQPPPPPPDPKQQQMQMEMAAKQQESQMKMELEKMKIQIKQMELMLKKQEGELKLQQAQEQMAVDQQKMGMDLEKAQMDMKIESMRGAMGLQQEMRAGEQKLQQNDASFKQKQEQQKVAAKTKGETKPKEK